MTAMPREPVILESDHTDNNGSVMVDLSANLAARSFHFGGYLDCTDTTPLYRSADLGLERQFSVLAERWRSETGGFSVNDRRVVHPAYQEIIGLGPRVIPIILRELQVRPDYWFWALRALTRENPVNEADAGRMPRMTEAWLNWGRQHGHLI